MTLYLDTSALVKLYVEEPGAAEVCRLVAGAAHVSTSRVTYVEARAALARRYRERALSRSEYAELVRALEHDWEAYLRLEVTEPIIKLAGEMTERHALRAYDAIQLASAVSMPPRLRITFLAADERLLAAASSEGLTARQVPA